jgi:hypothetical protein
VAGGREPRPRSAPRFPTARSLRSPVDRIQPVSQRRADQQIVVAVARHVPEQQLSRSRRHSVSAYVQPDRVSLTVSGGGCCEVRGDRGGVLIARRDVAWPGAVRRIAWPGDCNAPASLDAAGKMLVENQTCWLLATPDSAGGRGVLSQTTQQLRLIYVAGERTCQGVQNELEHRSPSGHRLPHLPQLLTSNEVLIQAPLQYLMPPSSLLHPQTLLLLAAGWQISRP